MAGVAETQVWTYLSLLELRTCRTQVAMMIVIKIPNMIHPTSPGSPKGFAGMSRVVRSVIGASNTTTRPLTVSRWRNYEHCQR